MRLIIQGTMKKWLIKISYLFIFVLSIFFTVQLRVYADIEKKDVTTKIPSEMEEYKSYEYVIDQYDINVIVKENNILDVTETITAYFNVPKHGIFRTIPLKNKIDRLDGSSSNNRVQISNVSVDNEYSLSKENGNYKIKIGSGSQTLTGKHTYVIKYSYNLGKDPLKDVDELYYNIIGSEWDTVIGGISFTVTMPKEFDQSKLGFAAGAKGTADSTKVNFNINEKVITGTYDGILRKGQALTIRCELPEGYFVDAGLVINPFYYIAYIIPILFLGIAFGLWYKFGRDDKIVETVEFYPPSGFNSLEVGFLYKGVANSQDVTSLLVYLANLGYIKITEIEEKVLFSKNKGFKITKLKEYDGNKDNERIFLDGLFKKNADSVTSNDLYNSFYTTMNEILFKVNNKENKNKIFEKSASSKKVWLVLMIIATYCLITIPPIWDLGDPSMLPIAILFPGIGFTVLMVMLFSNMKSVYVNGVATTSTIIVKLFGVIWGLAFGGIPWSIFILPLLIQDSFYLLGYIIGIGCILGIILCIIYLPKRTPYGNEMLGKIKGFKNFLETAEKEKLEAMVMQDPSYFYNILPFTYVLGVSDKWIKKFETITMQAPDWYDSSTSFNVIAFGTFINSTINSAQNAMSSSPASSSGGSSGGPSGGFSGGGISGGGSGGGGGGSW